MANTTRHRARPKRLVAEVMGPDEVARIDVRLATLGRGLGAMRLKIGEGLLRLGEGFRELGFPTLESYAREALERSGRWAGDVRALAQRLEGLPLLRAALVSGRLTSSMVEVLVKVATPEDEGDWIADATGQSVRAMRARIGAMAGPDEEAAPKKVVITATVDRVEAWAFERARLMIHAVGGCRGEDAVEAMLAEGLTELLVQDPGLKLPEGVGAWGDEAGRSWREELARMREEGDVVCESRFENEAVEIAADEVRTWPEGVEDIDGVLRMAAQDLAWRDLELADLARRCFEAEAWRRLGYASFDQYCRERVGLSPSSMATRVALSRRVTELPEIAGAVIAGRIGYEAAALIARVAGATTVEAWIERAERRTVKHLREELDAIETSARADGLEVERLPPPDEHTMADYRALERQVIAVVEGELGQISGSAADDDGGPGQMSERDVDDGGQEYDKMSVQTGGSGRVTLRLTLSDDVARLWRVVEGLHAPRSGESFVAFLVGAVTRAWAGTANARVAYQDVYARDRWRCASPVCRSGNLTPHHVVFRSHGGGEERENLISLCERCHLDLVHLGRLEVKGRAGLELEDMHWKARGWQVDGRRAGNLAMGEISR